MKEETTRLSASLEDYLKEIYLLKLPVYAIGGITPENLEVVRHAGAVGGCMMSLSMKIRE